MVGKVSNYYNGCLKDFEDIKTSIENKVANALNEYGKPLVIGNMVYTTMQWEERNVPCYAYRADIDTEGNPYYPIYDKEQTCEFGWTDFGECCRIFDVIIDKLNQLK